MDGLGASIRMILKRYPLRKSSSFFPTGGVIASLIDTLVVGPFDVGFGCATEEAADD